MYREILKEKIEKDHSKLIKLQKSSLVVRPKYFTVV